MSLMRTYTSLFQSDEIAWIIYQNAHLHPTHKLVVVLRKKIVSEVAFSDNSKTNKSSCCEHTNCHDS